MYLDVYWKVKNDPVFKKEIKRLATKMRECESAGSRNPKAQAVMASTIAEIYKLCDYNPGLLVPHFFPAYPERKPLTLQARPFSFSMFNVQVGGFCVMRASRQIGKCFGMSTLISCRLKNTSEIQDISAKELFGLACSLS